MLPEQLSQLNKVYEKWERKSGFQNVKKGVPKSGKTADYSTVIDQGKQRWREKYGHVIPAQRSQKRRRKKKEMLVSEESIQMENIANFKMNPIVKSDFWCTNRPFMGYCCHCLPQSRSDFSSNNLLQETLRNVLDVQSELRRPTYLQRKIPCLTYSLQLATNHQYPDVSKRVFFSAQVKEAIQKFAEKIVTENPEMTLAKVMKSEKKRSRSILNSMKASISNGLVRFTGWFLFKFFGLVLRTIQVHRAQLCMLAKAAEKNQPLIYLPLHKSHLDYILITYLLWNYNMKAPHVAAGDNLNIPVFSSLLRGLGGFFIRRKLDQDGKKDLIYRAVLQSYIQELLQQGASLEFFIEGGRSRSGKAYYPKGGLLSVVIDAYMNNLIDDAYIVPISISYEKLIEGNFCGEQMGLAKQKESFFSALRGIFSVVKGDYGSVRVEFSQPFSLKEFIEVYRSQLPLQPLIHKDGSVSPESISSCDSNCSLLTVNVCKDHRDLVQSLAEHVVYCSVNSTALMCTNLVAFLLLTKHRRGVELNNLVASIEWLVEELRCRNRDVGFSGKTQEVLHYAAALLGDELIQRSVTEVGDVFFYPVTSLPHVFELSYYSNPLTSAFVMESILVSAMLYVGDLNISNLHGKTVSIRKETLFETAKVLIKLLKYEHIVVLTCMQLDDILMDAFDQLTMKEIFMPDSNRHLQNGRGIWSKRVADMYSLGDEEDFIDYDEKIKVNTCSEASLEKIHFLQSILAPLFEAYLVATNHVTMLLSSEVPEAEFISTLHATAKDRVKKNLTTYNECVALETLKNAVKALEDLKIIHSFHSETTKMVAVLDESDLRQRLYDLIDLLEHLRD